jgi:molybdate transport system permease protein
MNTTVARPLRALALIAAVAAAASLVLLIAAPIAALIARGIGTQGWLGMPAQKALNSALWLSLWTTLVSILIIVVTGTPLAWWLARSQWRLRRLVNLLVELPIVIPPAVAGLALLLVFGRRGVVGSPLAEWGVVIAFSPAAVILAQVFVSAPFYVRSAQVAFRKVNTEVEDAARVDGADRWQLAWYVLFPLTRRALLAGLVLSWARAVGEFGATILFAGSREGYTQTLPQLVYGVFERDIDAAIWTSVILIGFALLALVLARLIDHDE